MKNKNGNMFSTVALSIEHTGSEYSAFCEASQSSDRFLCAGALLQSGEQLDFQIDVCGFTCLAQAATKAKISVEDFEWMFSSCSKAFTDANVIKDLFEDNRKVYAISTIDKKDGNCDDGSLLYECEDDRPSIHAVNELFNMFSYAGAVIRITSYGVAGIDAGYGKVLISMPEEISLRMRSVLSILFPKTIAVELDESDSDKDELNLTYKTLSTVTKRILYMMICQPEKKNESGKTAAGNENDESKNDPSPDDTAIEEADDAFTPLDQLDLSVRAYNCLKRAGIDTVEKLKTKSSEDLMLVRNLGRRSVEEVIQKLSEFKRYEKKEVKQKPDYMAMLNELIGLKEAKVQFRRIAALAKMQKDMADENDNSLGVVLNMEFLGNAGTAKTTVARIAAGILYETGILKSDETVEVGRADLVGEYVGHTAIKVKKVFERAKGKLLFIDEAYSLVDSQSGHYGDEAINTIVQEIENNRQDTVMILAGYPKQMDDFFKSNPGLRSRVPFTIHFSDYTCEEMEQIVELEAKKRGFSIDGEAIGKIKDICAEAAGQPDAGNGRFCRNLLEDALISYAFRTYENDEPACRDRTLTAEDFRQILHISKTQKSKIGFCA